MKKNTLPKQGWRGDRRDFLKMTGTLGLGVAATSLIPVGAEAVKLNRRLYKVSQARFSMGTYVSLTLIHPSKDQAEDAIGRAFEEVNRLVGILNRFDHTTAVSQLNKEGVLKDVPPEVAQVIYRSLHYNRLTAGAFDITVKPLVDLFRKTFASGRNTPPSEKAIEEALALVGSHKISFDGKNIRFSQPGMGITLDGIAKGFIVDRISELLKRLNIENHLINAGGDIRTSGHRKDKRPWRIAIEDPEKRGRYPDIIRLSNGAIATSGNYEVYFDRDKLFHHIVNPATGRSPRAAKSVSVVSKTTMEADALSTGIFVMSPEEGIRFSDSLKGCECLIVSGRGKKFMSSGWSRMAT